MKATRKIKGVLIDVDGTLLDSNDAHAQAWREALLESGIDVPIDEIRPLIGKGGDKLLRDVASIDVDSPEGKAISSARKRIFSDRYLAGLLPTRGARHLLARLRKEGLKLIIATSAEKDELASLLQQAGVDDLIREAATSADAEYSKPDPDIVQAALARSGLRADEVFMLGDTPFDIEAASAAGLATVVLRSGGWWNDEAFASAAAIYDDPDDMLRNLQDLIGKGSPSSFPDRSGEVGMGTSDQQEPTKVDMARNDCVLDYDRLRTELRRLWSAPERDMVAIDSTMKQLDEAHAAFKSLHGRDQQRY